MFKNLPSGCATGAIASALLALLWVMAPTSGWAGPGHDHGDAPASASSNAPKREPDGSVFLPKPSQRQLAIRTAKVETTREPIAFNLPGRVVIDALTGGRVQPTLTGRLQPGARGMPQPGQRVAKGEVLAYVLPTIGTVELANQRASAAELAASLVVARQRLARLQQLSGSVPQRDIDEAVISVDALSLRAGAIAGSVLAREALVAPVAGVVAGVSPSAVAGQVVEAREVLFEIVDPTVIAIEAMAFDAVLAADIASGTIVADGKSWKLQFAGASRSLREGQLPLMFRAVSGKNARNIPPTGEFPILPIGQTLTVAVQTRAATAGIAVTAAALVKNPSNQDIVWVYDIAEHFVPRVVRFAPLDGTRVLVTSGLKTGERVVVDGAPLINQVR